MGAKQDNLLRLELRDDLPDPPLEGGAPEVGLNCGAFALHP